MSIFYKIFPISTITKDHNLTSLIISLAVYIVAASVLYMVLGMFTWMPLIGWIFKAVRGITNLYCTLGIILSVLTYFNITQNG